MRQKTVYQVTVNKPDGTSVYQVLKPGERISINTELEMDYSVKILYAKGERKIKRIFTIEFSKFPKGR